MRLCGNMEITTWYGEFHGGSRGKRLSALTVVTIFYHSEKRQALRSCLDMGKGIYGASFALILMPSFHMQEARALHTASRPLRTMQFTLGSQFTTY